MGCALQSAVHINNNEGVKLLLNVQNIDVNTVDKNGWSAVHRAVFTDNIEALKLLLSHPSLTALTLNQKDNDNGDTPVKFAVSCPPDWITQLEHLEVLAADPRVDLDTTDKEGKSLEEEARDHCCTRVVLEAKQRREEKRRLNRLIRKQQRQVSKVLLDGLYDPDSPISKLLDVHTEVMGEIIWQKLVENWQIFPEHLRPSIHFPGRKIQCTVL